MKPLLFLGDICPDNNFRTLFDERHAGAFTEAAVDYFRQHRFVIANLECPATSSKRAITKTGPNITALPQDITILKNAGINHLAMANNHILDFGNEGLIDTLNACRKEQMPIVGCGLDSRSAREPLVVQHGELKVAIVAFAEEEFNLASATQPGAAHFDPYESLETIAELKTKVDRIVVLYHGGIEYYKYPSPELQKKCRAMVRHGADVVLCQHSHCIGTLEKYQNRHILYGQGNTCFGFKKGDDGWNEGLAVEYAPEENRITLRLLEATESGVAPASTETNNARLEEFYGDSDHCYDPEFLNLEWLKFCRGMKPLNMPLLFGRSKLYNRINRMLGNRLIDLCYGDTAKMITLELMRCEAHLEVMKTILEDEIQFHTSCQKYR